MSDHVVTADQLRLRGISGERLRERLRRGALVHLLGDVYCDRPPTTADKCRAVGLSREDAVLSHFTALCLHGLGAEPEVIEAYVSSEPGRPVPSWLRLHVAPYESYAADTVVL